MPVPHPGRPLGRSNYPQPFFMRNIAFLLTAKSTMHHLHNAHTEPEAWASGRCLGPFKRVIKKRNRRPQ